MIKFFCALVRQLCIGIYYQSTQSTSLSLLLNIFHYCRLSLPREWQGLRDKELSDKSGIPGCVFVHANGFIGGNETYDGVLAMAKYSLKQQT